MTRNGARSGGHRSWIGTALAFSLSTALAGAVTGALLGAAGGLLPPAVRLAAASLLAVPALALGGLTLAGRGVPPPQCDRETPQRWVQAGATAWAVSNGAALGCGATNRLGFWLWYAIPAGALLAGRPALGVLLYGTYGAVRGTMVWVLLLGLTRWVGDDYAAWLFRRRAAAQALAAGQLVLLGAAVAVALGL